ncbi:nucleotidyltransferase family protein [uncultured Ruminococcus sp.]|uniref:nucleotidyltransferase domain-containing protein n=1 Tax=uncultured Ruminococcus sp. TaxID=165186 RepID=UPI00292DFC59|nr:nucleotidyltransferase family protein [uncultured Ruminococcus sp.]
MAELSTLQSTWLHLLICALNGKQPDKEQLMKTNPQELYQLADAHSMLSITAFALNLIGVWEPHFEQAKTKALRKLALFDIERENIYRELNQAGIWFCPLKGIILKDDYPLFGMREMTDNDILCDPLRMADIKAVMENLGYECTSYNEWHHDTYAKSPCLEFEMHHSLFKDEQMPLFTEYYADIFDKLIPAENAEYRFTDEDFYIYMLAHEYKHFSHFGTGMRSLTDVYVFLKTHPDLDWEYLETELSKLKLTEFEQHSRELANKVFTNTTLTEDETEQLLHFYLDSSLYGSIENGEYNNLTRTLDGEDNKKVKAKYFLNRFFISGKVLEKNYPFFYRHKYLLPFLYVYRPFKGLITHPKGIIHDTKKVVKYKSPKHRY